MNTIQQESGQGIATLDDLHHLFANLYYKVSRTDGYLIVETEQLFVVVVTEADYISFRVNAVVDASLDDEAMRELTDTANLRWRMVRFCAAPGGQAVLDYEMLRDSDTTAGQIARTFRRFDGLATVQLRDLRQSAVDSAARHSQPAAETTVPTCH